MKRILFGICLIPVIILLFSNKAFAQSVTVTYDEFNTHMQEVMGLNINLNQNVWNGIVSTYEQHPDYKLACSKMGSSSRYYVIMNGSMYLDGNGYIVLPERSNAIYADTNASTTVNPQTLNFSGDTFYNSLEEFNQSFINIDYSNIFYLPQIPSPDIVMRYNSLNMENTYCIPAVAEIAPASISGYNLYLNVKAKLYVPTTVNISINNGHVSYDAVTLESSDIIDVLDYGSNYSMENEDIFDLDLNTISDGILQSEWQNLKSNTNTVFTGQLSGSTAFQSAVSDYNQYSKNALTMGNRVELFFTIYMVKDGVAYQGLTLRWYSTTPDTFDLSQNAYNVLGIITSKYNVVSDSVAKIYQSENASTPPNDPNDSSYLDLDAFIPYIMRQGSLKTAGSVPNNQNYPTIVAYNHDNIFTMFKDYYSSASEFFGGFAPFMNATLQWIPDEIWIIVAMGFMVAVIVMIVKVL